MAVEQRRRREDRQLDALRGEAVAYRKQMDRFVSTSATFGEWRRLQYECRRSYILAQRELIELHSSLVQRIKHDVARAGRGELVRVMHAALAELFAVLREIDRLCA